MQIQLDRWYQDVKGVRIAPGTYDTTDEKLHNLADYLVINGHAVMLDSGANQYGYAYSIQDGKLISRHYSDSALERMQEFGYGDSDFAFMQGEITTKHIHDLQLANEVDIDSEIEADPRLSDVLSVIELGDESLTIEPINETETTFTPAAEKLMQEQGLTVDDFVGFKRVTKPDVEDVIRNRLEHDVTN